MTLTQKQINDLITGISLAAELPAVSPQNRRFVNVMAYEINERGRIVRPDKILDSSKIGTLHFYLRDYEVPAQYIENDQDIPDGDITYHLDDDNIMGISDLERRLSALIPDFSVLVPEWETDDPL